MALSLGDCRFVGPALPEPFVKLDLDRHLARLSPLPSDRGAKGKELAERWDTLRRKLRRLGETGGDVRVLHCVLEPVADMLGYVTRTRDERVRTREGDEDGGLWMATADGASGLRAWTVDVGTDLDAPNRRGRAYRYSPARVAARVLLAKGERAGLLTDGVELRLLICDPARPDSHVAIALASKEGWRGSRSVPDSFRLLLALACPRGVAALPELIELARLSQTMVTKKLRQQARDAVQGFVQGAIDDPRNRAWREAQADAASTSRTLWQEGLVLIYRLLFVLKMESSADPARAFSFAATSLWRNSYSPNTALAPVVRAVIDRGDETGGFLEASLRTMFRMFADGLACSELKVSPLGGALFGRGSTPVLDDLVWGEHSVARLLDALLWTPGDGRSERQRVHYGALDVEDLGRVYEALLELEPGITTEPMCRLRRAKLEVVVPAAQGAAYRRTAPGLPDDDGQDDDDADSEDGGKKSKVLWIEDIPAGRFFLRTGLGRKSSGSYYTPHPFVRFLVQESLGPQIADRSPTTDPHPMRILDLKVLDPAMGSGHFLVEACRYLGDALYEACRLCDERAATAIEGGDHGRANELLDRVRALPDPNDELLAWLPTRAPEGATAGLSQQRAEALCRRLVAVHCLYGVDKNRLAVELAKLSLWLESYAEGLPLTFLDHRLVCGDSLTGPFLDQLLTSPRDGSPLAADVLAHGIQGRLEATLATALAGVRALTTTVGKDVADLEQKALAKAEMDTALAPFRRLAAAWSGAVMLGESRDDAPYLRAVAAVGDGRTIAEDADLAEMEDLGLAGVPYDIVFPEVFHPDGRVARTGGFDAVIGNPPWDRVNVSEKDFWSQFDVGVLDAPTKQGRLAIQRGLATPERQAAWADLTLAYEREARLRERLFVRQSGTADESTRGSPDTWRLFVERIPTLARAEAGVVGFVVPSSFHANEGGLAVRSLYLDEIGFRCLFSFENVGKRFFDIDARFKVDLVVAGRGRPSWEARFYLHDDGWLFSEARSSEALRYSRSFVDRTGGRFRTLVELTSDGDREVLETMCDGTTSVGSLRSRWKIDIRQEINITRGDQVFLGRTSVVGEQDPRRWEVLSELAERGMMVVDDDKTFHQYTDRWERWLPRYLTSTERLKARSDLLTACRHFRLMLRKTTGGRNERTGIFNLQPPFHIATDKSPAERTPQIRPNSAALLFLGLVNSFALDWMLRLRVQTDLNMFMLDVASCPKVLPAFLAHGALRLVCNHAGYESLWVEQVGEGWREPTAPHTWPVLRTLEDRWTVRAAMDAVVADAYGLSRAQFDHILSSFTHRSFPAGREVCLAAFDELQVLGREAFFARHDPYHDVPLNRALPTPVAMPGLVAQMDAVEPPTSLFPSD